MNTPLWRKSLGFKVSFQMKVHEESSKGGLLHRRRRSGWMVGDKTCRDSLKGTAAPKQEQGRSSENNLPKLQWELGRSGNVLLDGDWCTRWGAGTGPPGLYTEPKWGSCWQWESEAVAPSSTAPTLLPTTGMVKEQPQIRGSPTAATTGTLPVCRI